MTGLEGVGGTGDVGVVPVGVSIWVSPGIAVDSCWMPRPLLVLSWVEGAGAATADNGNALEEVPAEGAGLTAAPKDSDVAGAVVTDVAFAGATVLGVVGLSALESLFCVWGVVL